ncbi:MAG TPA: ATP-binding protein [Mycobacteriales bacterium]|nr:ATP-binding protein [Mycobacteriales bacterium]
MRLRERMGRMTHPSLSMCVGFAALLGGALLCLSVAGGLAATGRLDRSAGIAVVGLGGAVTLVLACVAALLAERTARALRVLRSDAVTRLEDPSGPTPARRDAKVPGSREIVELARTLEALHLRVRVADDVAERHRATAETASAGMYELLSGLVAAEEGARGQLAAELHDTVAQSLLSARQLLAEGHSDPLTRKAAVYVEEAEEQVRGVMARTRPPELRAGDLGQAVANLRDDLNRRYALVVDIHWPDEARPLPLVAAVTVYRFFQEALLNVVKHAEVDYAEAELTYDGEGLVATVVDHGPGFDPTAVRGEGGRQAGLGLLRDRARAVGGQLEISTPEDGGTRVRLYLPGTAVPAKTDDRVA